MNFTTRILANELEGRVSNYFLLILRSNFILLELFFKMRKKNAFLNFQIPHIFELSRKWRICGTLHREIISFTAGVVNLSTPRLAC